MFGMRRLTWAVALIACALVANTAAAERGSHHWSYGGDTGPTNWGSLEKEYSACALGHLQSPIDIRDGATKTTNLPAIHFDYKPSPLRIIDNGHTIQINHSPGSFITVGNKRYELKQFHFHRPSEEKINGKAYPMVAHLVHQDDQQHLAVVAVLLTTGASNPLVKTAFDNLPNEKEHESTVDNATVNAADLLPTSKAYYTFGGSLITPPCSEGVTWFVLKHPTPVSSEQIAAFGKSYPMNARPVQPLHGRHIAATR